MKNILVSRILRKRPRWYGVFNEEQEEKQQVVVQAPVPANAPQPQRSMQLQQPNQQVNGEEEVTYEEETESSSAKISYEEKVHFIVNVTTKLYPESYKKGMKGAHVSIYGRAVEKVKNVSAELGVDLFDEFSLKEALKTMTPAQKKEAKTGISTMYTVLGKYFDVQTGRRLTEKDVDTGGQSSGEREYRRKQYGAEQSIEEILDILHAVKPLVDELNEILEELDWPGEYPEEAENASIIAEIVVGELVQDAVDEGQTEIELSGNIRKAYSDILPFMIRASAGLSNEGRIEDYDALTSVAYEYIVELRRLKKDYGMKRYQGYEPPIDDVIPVYKKSLRYVKDFFLDNGGKRNVLDTIDDTELTETVRMFDRTASDGLDFWLESSYSTKKASKEKISVMGMKMQKIEKILRKNSSKKYTRTLYNRGENWMSRRRFYYDGFGELRGTGERASDIATGVAGGMAEPQKEQRRVDFAGEQLLDKINRYIKRLENREDTEGIDASEQIDALADIASSRWSTMADVEAATSAFEKLKETTRGTYPARRTEGPRPARKPKTLSRSYGHQSEVSLIMEDYWDEIEGR